MPLKPFPHPICIGTDILHLPRLYRLLTAPSNPRKSFARSPLSRFVSKLLTPTEQGRLSHKYPQWRAFYNLSGTETLLPGIPVQGSGNVLNEKEREGIVRWLGGRWCVKEAARKAVGAGQVGWKDVWTRIEPGGRVECAIRTKRLDIEPQDSSARLARCSISHDGEYVTAVVMAVEESGQGLEDPFAERGH
jgi:phosphopantetheinyl transferase (holo-ACP synthase)